VVCTSWIDAVLIRDDFPEFGANLISTLTTLDVNDFAHGGLRFERDSTFFKMWEALKPLILTALDEVGCQQGTGAGLYITGHSIGAALSHLSMFAFVKKGYIPKKVYTFEAPRSGNEAYADAFANLFAKEVPVFRITHHMDPVVHLPPRALGYEHVQTEVYYDAEFNYKVCEHREDPLCANKHGDLPLDIAAHAGEHCATNLVPGKSFCYPRGCLNMALHSDLPHVDQGLSGLSSNSQSANKQATIVV